MLNPRPTIAAHRFRASLPADSPRKCFVTTIWLRWKCASESLRFAATNRFLTARAFFFCERAQSLLANEPLQRTKLVVFESVYSMSGTVGPIKEILDLCAKYNALSFIDEVQKFVGLLFGLFVCLFPLDVNKRLI